MEKWYTVTFEAKMTEEDVHSMRKYFYETMEQDMDIKGCTNLDIEESTFQDGEHDVLVLEQEELLEFDTKTGNIKVDKNIFDCYEENAYVNIHFVEDDYEHSIEQYKMIAEDDDGIIMEYIG